MSTTFEPVQSEEDLARLAAMASDIWHEYWPALIGEEQTNYMVEQFQSLPALRRDTQEHGYEYWFICEHDETGASAPTPDSTTHAPASSLCPTPPSIVATSSVEDAAARVAVDASSRLVMPAVAPLRIAGYTGGRVEAETNRFFISKIYLYAQERGKGLASATIRFYERLCRERGLTALYLTVNKHNELGIRAYRAKGFETIDAVETNIGNGFVMDDYIMEKRVAP